MGWRKKLAEYEADLYPVPRRWLFNFPKGEVEYEAFDDGEKQLEVKVFGLKVADGEGVSLATGQGTVCEIVVQRGRGHARLSNRNGDALPEVAAGDEVEIYHLGKLILSGSFRSDD
jgi:hypothetical protein